MQSTFSRRAFLTALGMLSVPLVAFAQDKEEGRRRQEKGREEERSGEESGDEKGRTMRRNRSRTGTKPSIPPGPITVRTGGGIDAAMQPSDHRPSCDLTWPSSLPSASRSPRSPLRRQRTGGPRPRMKNTGAMRTAPSRSGPRSGARSPAMPRARPASSRRPSA